MNSWGDVSDVTILPKRLEKQRFRWPSMEGETVQLSARELNWLLDGLDIERMKER